MSTKTLAKPTSRSMTTQRLVVTAMLCALAYVAALLSQVIPAVQGFLSYDPKDAVVAIGGFIYGPIAAAFISIVSSLIEMFTISSTGLYGFLMNVVSTCAFALPAALIYKKARSMKGAILGLVAGMVCMTVMMLLWNYVITPFYLGAPRAFVAAMLPTVILPFNLVKSGINTGLTLLLYKPLVGALRAARLLPKSENETAHFRAGLLIAAVLVVATFTLLFLVLLDVL